MAVVGVVVVVAAEMAVAVVVGLELVVIEPGSIEMVALPVVEGPRMRSIQWRHCTWSLRPGPVGSPHPENRHTEG